MIGNKTETFHKVYYGVGLHVCTWNGESDGTMNIEKCQQIVENTLLLTTSKFYLNRDCIYEQDGPSRNTAKNTKQFGDQDVRALS